MSGDLLIGLGRAVRALPFKAASARSRPTRTIVVKSVILFNPPLLVVDDQLDVDCGEIGE